MSPSDYEGTARSEAVRIWLLGGFRVSVGSRTIEDAWRLRKAASLVKLLALAPGHRLHREQAMDLLWPELLGKKTPSNSLRQVLYAARRALDPASDSHGRHLSLNDEQILLCPEGELWVDVDAFEEAVLSARRSRDPAACRAALDLYAGELLPEDRYEEWTEGRREELRQLYLALQIKVAGLYEERHEHGLAIEALRKATAEEPTLEEAHVNLMRLHALSGRSERALSQYERLRDALSRALGTQPAATTRHLRDEIAVGRFPPTLPPDTPPQEEKPPGVGKHNLPAARTSFVGREREMTGAKRELAMTRLLTLTGAGGSGKTRLALEVARDLIGAYPDGVWLVELAPLSEPDLVAQEVAGSLEVPERPGEPLADTLVNAVGDKRLLLIMDNCEHLVEEAAQLVDVLLDSCSHLRVLVTSREPLGVGGEVLWQVSPLSLPELTNGESNGGSTVEGLMRYEAVRLFVDRARLRLPDFGLSEENTRAVARVCRMLEGMPLAIELATARMGALAVEQVVQKLEVSLVDVLKGASRTGEPRQQTLRASLDWSYKLLSEAEPTLFRRLSIFAGGWTLEAAEAMCSGSGIEAESVLDLLGALVDKSLVVAGGRTEGAARYKILEPIRQYALEKLEQSEEAEDVKRAHAQYFLALAEEAEPQLIGPREAGWFAHLEEEFDNFRAALSWARARGEAEVSLRLAGALMTFWFCEGYFGEGRRWLEGALTQEGHTSALARAKALGAASMMAAAQGDLGTAKGAAEEGLRLSKEAGIEGSRGLFFPTGNAATFFLNLLASLSMDEGDPERARALGEESLALARQADLMQGVVGSLVILAAASSHREDYEQAEKLYAEGLSLSRALASAFWRFQYLINWGWTALLQGDLERATALAEEAVELARERRRGFMGMLPLPLDTLGWATLLGGEPRQAKARFEENLTVSKDLGDNLTVLMSLEGLACVAGAEGETLRAARLFGAADALMEAIGSQLKPQERVMLEPYLVTARSMLSEAEWEVTFTEGRNMRFEEAVEYALPEEGPVTPLTTVAEQSSAEEPSPTLTRREREVANLLERRFTSRRIASELHLSERTVDKHVANILRKFNLHSREQVAVQMAKQRSHPY